MQKKSTTKLHGRHMYVSHVQECYIPPPAHIPYTNNAICSCLFASLHHRVKLPAERLAPLSHTNPPQCSPTITVPLPQNPFQRRWHPNAPRSPTVLTQLPRLNFLPPRIGDSLLSCSLLGATESFVDDTTECAAESLAGALG